MFLDADNMGRLLYVFQIDSIGFYVFNVDGADYEVGGGYIVIYGGWVVSLSWNKKMLVLGGGASCFYTLRDLFIWCDMTSQA